MSTHILTSYDAALDAFHANITRLSSMVAANLDLACQGVIHADEAACTRAIADDAEVNEMERQIDAMGMDILTRFQPVAKDLRMVIAVMRVASNLERISDEAKNIARRGRNLAAASAPMAELVELFAMARKELADAIAGFLARDRELAATIRPQDKVLDAKHRSLIEALAGSIAAEHANATHVLHQVFITRSLERIGDHAKNIAEETAFLCGPHQRDVVV